MNRKLRCTPILVGLLAGTLLGCPDPAAHDESDRSEASALASGETAGPTADAASEGPPQDLETTLATARQMLAENKGQEAVDLLAPLFRSHPSNRTLNLLYGRALMQIEKVSLATWHLQRAAEAEGAPRDVMASFVFALTVGGAEPNAIEVADAVLAEDPGADAIRFQRISALASVMRKEEALEDLAYLLDKKPDATNLLQAQFNLHLELEQFEEARDTLAEIGRILETTQAPADQLQKLCAARGKFELDQKRFDVAREIFEGCLARKSDHVDVIFLMEELLDTEQKGAEATAFLEAAARRMPRHLRVQLRLASRYFRLGMEEEGAKTLTATAERIGSTTAWLTLADRRVLIRDLPGAVEAIDKAIVAETGVSPSDPAFSWSKLPTEAAFAFGDVFIRAGEFERAEEIIRAVEPEEKAYALLLSARMHLVRGDPAAALATYDEAFKYNPSNPGARYLAGRAAMETGDFERGATLYQDALRSDASANDAGLVLARMQMAQGLPGACIDTLGYFMRLNLDHPHGLRLFAQAASALGMGPPAEGARTRLHDNPQWAGLALADHAQELVLSQGLAAAETYLEASGELEIPTHFEALAAWIEIKRSQGELDVAAKRVERLVGEQPDAAGFQIALGRVRQHQGRDEEAIAAYRRSVELAPDLLAAHRQLGAALAQTALAQNGETREALAAFDRATHLDPLDPEAALLSAQFARDAGQLEEARRRFREVLIQHPWHGVAALGLARLRAEAGEWDDETRILAEQAVRFIKVSGPEAHAFQGRYLLEAQRPEAAVASLARALNMGLTTPSTRLLYARALALSGDPRAARGELEKLLGPDTVEFEERSEAASLLEKIVRQEAG